MGCAPRHHQAHGGIKLGRSQEISQAAHFCTVGRFSATVERLLERLPAPGDRRATLVSLTPAGRRHIEEWRAFQRQLAEDAMAPLGPNERRELMTLLHRVNTAEPA